MKTTKIEKRLIYAMLFVSACLIILFCNPVEAITASNKLEISYNLPTSRASGKPLDISDIKLIRVYNELDGVRELIKEVPTTSTSTELDNIYFGCIRLSTVDLTDIEGILSEIDKSAHCFDLPLSPNDIKIRIVWTVGE